MIYILNELWLESYLCRSVSVWEDQFVRDIYYSKLGAVGCKIVSCKNMVRLFLVYHNQNYSDYQSASVIPVCNLSWFSEDGPRLFVYLPGIILDSTYST